MTKAQVGSKCGCSGLSAWAGLALCLQAPIVGAQSLKSGHTNDDLTGISRTHVAPRRQRAQSTYDPYILGPGDGLQIELLDLPELSGYFSIGPDGTLYLPRLRSLYVEGLTVEELRLSLTKLFSAYVLDPEIYVRPVVYRPIRIYVGGEVKRPGYYTLTGAQVTSGQVTPYTAPTISSSIARGLSDTAQKMPVASSPPTTNLFTSVPTVFDAIRNAQGITPYSDLSRVQVTRKRSEGLGGGHIRTNLDFISLITAGNESHNIRLYDGDVVRVSKSENIMREQLLKASQSNLSPQFFEVFVSGRVKKPGSVSVPQGSSLNQAIAVAGGPRLIKGRVEFMRFTQDGEAKRRLFSYDPRAAAGTIKNPLLSAGDLIRIQDSLLSATTTVVGEITSPLVGIYTLINLLEGF